MYSVIESVVTIVAMNGPAAVSIRTGRGGKGVLGLTILQGSLSEGRAGIEDDTGEDVLETRQQEKCRVFRVFDIGLVMLDLGRNIPVQYRQFNATSRYIGTPALTMAVLAPPRTQLLEWLCR